MSFFDKMEALKLKVKETHLKHAIEGTSAVAMG
jgi:hypothetical protein